MPFMGLDHYEHCCLCQAKFSGLAKCTPSFSQWFVQLIMVWVFQCVIELTYMVRSRGAMQSHYYPAKRKATLRCDRVDVGLPCSGR